MVPGCPPSCGSILERAQTDGSLRTDVVPEDLVLLLMANAGVVDAAGRAAPDAWRQLLGLMLDGFRSQGASTLPEPRSPRQMMVAVRRLARPIDEGPGAAGRTGRPGSAADPGTPSRGTLVVASGCGPYARRLQPGRRCCHQAARMPP